MSTRQAEEVRKAVRETYGGIARQGGAGCGCGPSGGCCPEGSVSYPEAASTRIGYSQEDVTKVPEGANMGLGCGNPISIADIKPGETVLDLGSGGGFDCFLAAEQVGETGKVIGVDMTPDMIAKANKNAKNGGYKNVEFRLGEIEHIPVGDSVVDVIISNCVINLSPDKQKVFKEAFRVLRPGGRLSVSDIVATAVLPEEVRNDLELISGCVAGAVTSDALETILSEVGFEKIRIRPKDGSREVIRDWAPGGNVADYILSATIEAVKPKG